jgi:hypothetical protein
MSISIVALHPSPVSAGVGYAVYAKAGPTPQALCALSPDQFTKALNAVAEFF